MCQRLISRMVDFFQIGVHRHHKDALVDQESGGGSSRTMGLMAKHMGPIKEDV